jgi:hypothetical protein
LSKPPPVHPSTSQILSNLRKWNPEVAAGFSEKESAVKDIPFKLVTTSPTWSSPDIDGFVAISYSWHNGEWEVPARFRDAPADWPFPVCPAMLKTMVASFEDGPPIFWLDQSCINQEDSSQKVQAIANMDTIYRNASKVLILLEDFDINPDAERSLHMLAVGSPEPENATSGNVYLSESVLEANFSSCFAQGKPKHLHEFVEEFFDCYRWFARAWCSQEYQLNAKRTFLVVSHNFQYVALDFTFFLEFLVQAGETDDISTHPVLQMYAFGAGSSDTDVASRLDLPSVFVELENVHCFYLGDIISIALNTSGIFLTFVGEVSSRADCQFILGLLLLAAGSPTILDSVGPLYKWPAPGYQGVTRWPVGDDFRYYDDAWELARMSSDHGIDQVCRGPITLDIFVFRSRPMKPSREHTEAANAWLLRSQKQRSKLATLDTETLAAALHIGLPWTAIQVRDFHLETPILRPGATKKFEIGKTGPYVLENTAAENIYQVTEELIETVLVNLRFVERTTPWIVALNKAGTRHAIVFMPLRLCQKDWAQFTIAVPVALATPTAACVRRLWVLARSKTSASDLAMVGRGYYFGDEIRMNDDVTLIRGVTVSGRWQEDNDDYESAEEWDDDPDDVDEYGIEWDSDGGRW